MVTRDGIPPSHSGKDSRNIDQSAVYRPGNQASPNYGNRQAAASNGVAMYGGDGETEAEEEVRKPVQYRF